MFESSVKIVDHIRELLAAFREMADGQYACVLESKGILFEDPQPSTPEVSTLRRLLEARRSDVLALGRNLASDQSMNDIFEGWDHAELLVAVINEKVALVVACPEAESLREHALKPLKALADRLFRYDERFRLNPAGGGFFFGRPKLDLIVVGRERER